jgi:hypothetical protein
MSIEPIGERSASRCYCRPKAIAAARTQTPIEGSTVVLVLSLISAIIVFLLAYRGSVL